MKSATAKQISESRLRLENPYAYLDGESGYSASVCALPNTNATAPILLDIDLVRNPKSVGTRLSYEKIEAIAKSLQNSLWKERGDIFGGAVTDDLVDVLSPPDALRALGYRFGNPASLGQFRTEQGLVEVAGFIDRSEMYAGVSAGYPREVQNFTAAHELGHAALHNAVGMHRDRALDGSAAFGKRNRAEIEADKFATYFLMPERLVRREFSLRFHAVKFIVGDDTTFHLTSGTQETLKKRCRTLRHLTRLLADADRYAGGSFVSMAKRFSVSNEAMAIRLEELDLVQV